MFIVTKSCVHIEPETEIETRMFMEKYFFNDEQDEVKKYVHKKSHWLWGEEKTNQQVKVESAVNPCGHERKIELQMDIFIKDGHRKWIECKLSAVPFELEDIED